VSWGVHMLHGVSRRALEPSTLHVGALVWQRCAVPDVLLPVRRWRFLCLSVGIRALCCLHLEFTLQDCSGVYMCYISFY
jgi:hypothetical protein